MYKLHVGFAFVVLIGVHFSTHLLMSISEAVIVTLGFLILSSFMTPSSCRGSLGQSSENFWCFSWSPINSSEWVPVLPVNEGPLANSELSFRLTALVFNECLLFPLHQREDCACTIRTLLHEFNLSWLTLFIIHWTHYLFSDWPKAEQWIFEISA